MEHTWMSHSSCESNAGEMSAQRLLPSLGSVACAVQTQSQLPDLVAAEVGVLSRELNEDVALNLGVEVRAPHVIHHDFLPHVVLPDRGGIADDDP